MNKIFSVIAISILLMLNSSFASAATINVVDVDYWAIDEDGMGGAGSDGFMEMNYLDYNGSTFADSTVDQGDDITAIDSGDTFVDYGYLYATSGYLLGTEPSLEYSIITAVFVDVIGTYTNEAGEALDYDFESGSLTLSIWDSEIATVTGPTGNDVDITVPSAGTETELLDLSIVEGTTLVNQNANGTYTVSVTLAIDEVLEDDYVYFYLDGEYVDLYDVDIFTEDGTAKYYLTSSTTVNVISQETAIQSGIAQSLLDAYDLSGEGAAIDDFDPLTAIGVSASTDGGISAQEIPEPGMLGIMGLAFLGLAGFQRRRRHS